MKLYHGTPVQFLKTITPRKLTVRNWKDAPAVYATPDKDYAACFTVGDVAMELGCCNDEPWELCIGNEDVLSQPCSVYEVEAEGFEAVEGATTPEFRNVKQVRVLKEFRYPSVRECIESHRVILKMGELT